MTSHRRPIRRFAAVLLLFSLSPSWVPSGRSGELGAGVLTLLPGPIQDPATPAREDVRRAIEGGVAWLGKLPDGGRMDLSDLNFRWHDLHELLALTLLVCDVDPGDPFLARLLEYLKRQSWQSTYNVALRAAVYSLLLEKNPDDGDSFVRLAISAKFLAASQLHDGSWSYGYGYMPSSTAYGAGASGTAIREMTAQATESMMAFGKTIQARLKEQRQASKSLKSGTLVIAIEGGGLSKPRFDLGDYSNSQLAALGLLAAAPARLRLTPTVYSRLTPTSDTLEKAIRGWISAQNADGGWGYYRKDLGPSQSGSYGSMTAGGAFSLQALERLAEGLDPKALASPEAEKIRRSKEQVSKALEKATRWVETQFSTDSNPRIREVWPAEPASLYAYYSLFSLERAATLLKREKFGSHDWYAEGTEFLLKGQAADGSWPEETIAKWQGEDSKKLRKALSTCFALLFLKRATARISRDVATK